MKLDSDFCEKTAFSAAEGHYKFTSMPFGIKNASAEFSRRMRRVLGQLDFVEAYLDDNTFPSKSPAGHIETLMIVFGILRKYNLKLNGKKCHCAMQEIWPLGFVDSEKFCPD